MKLTPMRVIFDSHLYGTFRIFASKTTAEDLFLFCLLSLLDNSLKFLAEKDHLFLHRKHYRCLPLREMMGQS